MFKKIKKFMKRYNTGIVMILMFILTPIVLDKVILQYSWMNTNVDTSDWMNFFGSYLPIVIAIITLIYENNRHKKELQIYNRGYIVFNIYTGLRIDLAGFRVDRTKKIIENKIYNDCEEHNRYHPNAKNMQYVEIENIHENIITEVEIEVKRKKELIEGEEEVYNISAMKQNELFYLPSRMGERIGDEKYEFSDKYRILSLSIRYLTKYKEKGCLSVDYDLNNEEIYKEKLTFEDISDEEIEKIKNKWKKPVSWIYKEKYK